MPVQGILPGFFLCVSRLLPYKNVDVVMAAFADLPSDRLVVVGSGPEWANLKKLAPPNVQLVGAVSDEELAWLYANSAGIISASYEDYGLTPLEAAAFGKPCAALRWGGFLDTVIEDQTGVFFASPNPFLIRQAVSSLNAQRFNTDAIRTHASRYSEERFVDRLREIVLEESRAK
jgi:glycosyltransferase involved in cell wall biosynthesis